MARDRGEWEPVEIEDVTALRETDGGALVFTVGDGELEYTVPLKVISPDSEVDSAGDHGTLVIPRKFADEKGLT